MRLYEIDHKKEKFLKTLKKGSCKKCGEPFQFIDKKTGEGVNYRGCFFCAPVRV